MPDMIIEIFIDASSFGEARKAVQLRPAPSSSLNRRKRRRSGPTKSDVEALLCDVCLPDGDRIRGQLFINIRAGAAEGGRGQEK
jgi:hypothetical protein